LNLNKHLVIARRLARLLIAAVLRPIAAVAQLLPQLVDLAAQILNGLTNSTLVGWTVAAR
jgi:hypothetical protein